MDEISDLELSSNMLKSLCSVIKQISDPDYQRRVWLGNLPDLRSSYVDVYHTIADDINFDLIASVRDKLGISAEVWDLIMKFRAEFLEFDSRWSDMYADEAIIEDARWRNVVELAKAVLAGR